MRSCVLADVVKSRNVRCIAERNRKLKGTLEECVRPSTYWLYEKLVAVSIDAQYADSKAVRNVATRSYEFATSARRFIKSWTVIGFLR
jgi:hypothetical protein